MTQLQGQNLDSRPRWRLRARCSRAEDPHPEGPGSPGPWGHPGPITGKAVWKWVTDTGAQAELRGLRDRGLPEATQAQEGSSLLRPAWSWAGGGREGLARTSLAPLSKKQSERM